MRASLKLVDITPPIGCEMGGFELRDHGSEGIHDPLYAQIVVLDDGETKVAYVVCDILGLDKEQTDRIREMITSETDIRKENIMIGATHTHSGPYMPRWIDLMTKKNDKIIKKPNNIMNVEPLIEKIVYGVLWASKDLQEAKLGFGMGQVKNFGTNRNDPNDYYDFSVNVIKFETLDNKLMGMLVNHACHPTAVNEHNYLYSADYPGLVREHLAKMFPQAVMIFSTGFAGSASFRFSRKGNGFNEASRLSLILAGEVIKILPTIEEWLTIIANDSAKLEELKESNANPRLIRQAAVTLSGA